MKITKIICSKKDSRNYVKLKSEKNLFLFDFSNFYQKSKFFVRTKNFNNEIKKNLIRNFEK